ncbi:MAG TPA: cytidine deaminase [Thermoanaerobaculia bacterium]|nr:cytidine deaminase [Thermoanaerobaculia bacterium]
MSIAQTIDQKLIDEAKLARENAVAPFSKFKVGAALRTKGGKVFRGCNVENCSYGLTVCAERVALLSALAAGEREFDAIVVITQSDEPSTPCGPCRQLMWEYCGDIEIALTNLAGARVDYKLSDLFPHPFFFSLE